MLKIVRIIGVVLGVFLGWVGGIFFSAASANILLPEIFKTSESFYLIVYRSPIKLGIFLSVPTILSFVFGYLAAPKSYRLKVKIVIISLHLTLPLIGVFFSGSQSFLNAFILWLWKVLGLGLVLVACNFVGRKRKKIKDKLENNASFYFMLGVLVFLLGLGGIWFLDMLKVSSKIIGMGFLTTIVSMFSLFGKAFFMIFLKLKENERLEAIDSEEGFIKGGRRIVRGFGVIVVWALFMNMLKSSNIQLGGLLYSGIMMFFLWIFGRVIGWQDIFLKK